MSELWLTFCDSLKQAGYSINDLAFCSDDLFLTIAEEIGTFSPEQVSLLLKEWHRRLPQHQQQQQQPTEKGPAAKEAAAGDVDLQKKTYASALKLLERLSQRSGSVLEVAAPEGLIAIEMSQAAHSAFESRRAEMISGAGPETILWKLCSPATLAKIQKFCVAGAPCVLSAQHDDPDTLCPSALVLYSEQTKSLALPPGATYGTLCRDGWALVAFQCVVGNTRQVSAEEAANLGAYTTAQCLDMLKEAGYDSLTVQSPAATAVAVFHPHQLLPCQVVYYTDRAERLDFSSVQQQQQQHAPSQQTATPPRAFQPLPQMQSLPRPQAPQQQQQQYSTPGGARQGNTSEVASSAAYADVLCDIHPQKEVEFWSPKEKRLLCSHCLYYEGYTRENCVPIEAAVRQEAPRLERWVQNAVTFSKEVDSVFELLGTAGEDVANADAAFRDDIHHQLGRVRARLDEIEARLGSESRSVTKQRQQDLKVAGEHVDGIVQEVRAIVEAADGPLRAYRGGSAGFGVAVHLLRGVQRAFGKWEPVPIPSYEVVERMQSFIDGLEAQLRTIPALTTAPGRVELPEAIDVNFLKETD